MRYIRTAIDRDGGVDCDVVVQSDGHVAIRPLRYHFEATLELEPNEHLPPNFEPGGLLNLGGDLPPFPACGFQVYGRMLVHGIAFKVESDGNASQRFDVEGWSYGQMRFRTPEPTRHIVTFETHEQIQSSLEKLLEGQEQTNMQPEHNEPSAVERFEETIARHAQDLDPDFAAIWDELGRVPAILKRQVIAEIQSRQRDRFSELERQRRIEEIREREREQLRLQRERLLDEMETAHRDAQREIAAEKWKIQQARRRIDLDAD